MESPLKGLTQDQKAVAVSVNSFYLNADQWLGKDLTHDETLVLVDFLVYVRYGDGDYEDTKFTDMVDWAIEVLNYPNLWEELV